MIDRASRADNSPKLSVEQPRPPRAQPIQPPCRPAGSAEGASQGLAGLHAELASGAHRGDPAGALADVMHKHVSKRLLAKLAAGRLGCKEGPK
jgi:hypothetical protein